MEEPKRLTFLDVLKGHIRLADRFALITRYVYVGEYVGDKDALLRKIDVNIKELNEEYGEIVFTGFFLLYPRFFVHMIEATEEKIYRHLQCLLVCNMEKNVQIQRIIALPPYHNVYKMFFSRWYHTFVKNPPVLLNNIEKHDLDEIKMQIKNCLFKIYSLCEYLMDVEHESKQKFNESLKSLDKLVPHFLPEVTIVEYLLSTHSPVLHDLEFYLKKFNEIPFINFYNDCVWPPPSVILPRTIKIDTEKEEDQG